MDKENISYLVASKSLPACLDSRQQNLSKLNRFENLDSASYKASTETPSPIFSPESETRCRRRKQDENSSTENFPILSE